MTKMVGKQLRARDHNCMRNRLKGHQSLISIIASAPTVSDEAKTQAEEIFFAVEELLEKLKTRIGPDGSVEHQA